MDKKVIWLVAILAVAVIFFSSAIIIMERQTTKPSASLKPSLSESIPDGPGASGIRKYDVYKPKKEKERKRDLQFAPNLEYKFTGQEPILDI